MPIAPLRRYHSRTLWSIIRPDLLEFQKMGGSTGGLYRGGRTAQDAIAARAYRRQYDRFYGPGWKDALLKTLDQELRDRGIEPKPGDDNIAVGAAPRRPVPWIFIAFVVAVAALLIYAVTWELIPDAPGEFCPSPFAACERVK